MTNSCFRAGVKSTGELSTDMEDTTEFPVLKMFSASTGRIATSHTGADRKS